LVLFAHGSGSSRRSPRNRFVAEELHRVGLATLLFDLLTNFEEEEGDVDGRLRFDIDFLARRLVAATDWVLSRSETRALPIAYFGASTGAAAALVAAASRPDVVAAVVSRGGRPDLALEQLRKVRAPTLLLVGALDVDVLGHNRMALERLGCDKELHIIPGASHLFEERGTLEQVARIAASWLVDKLAAPHAGAPPHRPPSHHPHARAER
ncbi:MAG: dienelactone hydrolase family protein, partial [Polyangiales bacterium]